MNNEHAIAIVGMALRFPDADTPQEFWDNLRNGRGAVAEVDTAELLARGARPSDLAQPNYVRRVSALRRPEMFDAEFFGMTSREAQLADPQLRVLLQVCHEAIEDSGHVLNGTRTGVYVGVADNDFWLANLIFSTDAAGAALGNRVFVRKDYFPTQLSHKLNLFGPSVSVMSACSTSLVAVQEACTHLLMYDCDFAVAGGCEIDQRLGYLWEEGGIQSQDGHCRAFSADANGTIFGSGCGVVVLRRYQDAVRDGDHIHGVILACRINNDGRRKAGFTAPSVAGQEQLIHETIATAGVSAAQISFVEAHGTGTLIGDPIEIQALTQVFRHYTTAPGFCAIGSVKPNVGHLSVAAGIAGLIKVSLALQHREIPPLLHFNGPNPAIDFATSPFYVPTELRSWEPSGMPRVAAVSAFGVGGTNAHAVITEAPPRAAIGASRRWQLLPLSAKSKTALEQARGNLARFIVSEPQPALADVAYTLQVGRAEYAVRCAAVCATHDVATLGEDTAWHCGPEKPSEPGPTVFMFPGQGSQYAGMSAGLYADEPVFKAQVDQCAELLREDLGLDLRELLYPEPARREWAEAQLRQTCFTQPALFVVSYAMARLLQSWGIEPALLIGHSIGEYVAACLAGVCTLPDCLRLVALRGQLMQSAPRGSMLSVAAPADDIRALVPASLDLAVVNSSTQCVVAGTQEEITRFAADLAERGVQTQPLLTSHAFHSRMMEGILERFADAFRQVRLNAPLLPFISNVTGELITAEQATDPGYWVRQLRGTVQFARGIDALCARGAKLFIEVGPGTALSTLLRQGDRNAVPLLRHAKTRDEDSRVLFKGLGTLWSAGLSIDWQALHAGETRQRLSLPTYPFQQKKYWIETREQAARRALGAAVHPLLGQRWSSSARFNAYENEISARNPVYLADHRLLESVIFPGAAYCEMALAAAARQLGNRTVRIEQIRFQRALILRGDDPCVLQMVVAPEADGRYCFEIMSTSSTQRRDHEPRWEVHSSGTFSALPPSAPTYVDLEELQQRIATAIDVTNLYQVDSIQYGPCFRALEFLAFQGNEALGRICLPRMLEATASEYHFHPVLLDACFQAVGAFPAYRETLALPQGLLNVAVHAPIPERFWVHMVMPEGAGHGRSDARISIIDESGSLLASIESYQRKELSADSLAATDSPDTLLHEIAWVARDLPVDAASTRERAACLLLTDDVAAAQQLVANLPMAELATVHDYTQDKNLTAALRTVQARALAHACSIDVVMLRVAERELPVADLCDVLLRTVQDIEAGTQRVPHRLALVTRGAQSVVGSAVKSLAQASGACLWGMGSAIAKECPQLQCLRLDLDPDARLDAWWLPRELSRASGEDLIAYRGATRYVARLGRLEHSSVASGAGQPFRIGVEEFGVFENLTPRLLLRRAPRAGEVEVEMYSAGLNFKETLITLGMLDTGYAAPQVRFGFEGAGRVVAVGKLVTSVAPGDLVVVWASGCLASHVTVPADSVMKVNLQRLTLEQAASLPTVFMTAQYALHDLAQLRRGDRVLIHAAAGGVGQAAIQLARAAGAEIFATASRGKWEFLAAQGIQHIFDSRDPNFVAPLLAATGGAGIDVVLNSLSGDFITNSFDVLAHGGRFIEIGKLNIWSSERAREYRSDVSYHAFELGVGSAGGSGLLEKLLRPALQAMESQVMQPLPVRVFTLPEIVPAFRWLAAGRNIGKAVVRIRAAAEPMRAASSINKHKQYLVSGGLGALGLHVAEWLVHKGARDVVLLGRRQPDAAAGAVLQRLRQEGADVRVANCDVADRAALTELFAHLPNLAGIVHCAGVLDDGVIHAQSRERFEKVLRPKVTGADLLHELSTGHNLDFFVCYSSTSALIDGAGQCNYAAANAYLDALIQHRRALGLPGLSIAWGAWSEAGMAAKLWSQRSAADYDFIHKDEALAAFELLLDGGCAHAVVSRLRHKLTGVQGVRLFEQLAAHDQAGPAQTAGSFDALLAQSDGDAGAAAKLLLRREVCKSLGIAAGEIDEHDNFMSLGIDSLALAELRNSVNRQLAKTVPIAAFLAHPTIATLGQHIGAEYFAARRVPQQARSLSAAQVVVLNARERATRLFCLPGVGNNVFDFQPLADTGIARSICVLHAHESASAFLPDEITFLAQQHVAAIMQAQPRGPYHLLGYSFGASVAVEIANQLMAAGSEVAELSLLDAVPSFHYRGDPHYVRIAYFTLFESLLDSFEYPQANKPALMDELRGRELADVIALLRRVTAAQGAPLGFGMRYVDAVLETFARRLDIRYQAPARLGDLTITFFRAMDGLACLEPAKGLQLLPRFASLETAYGWEDVLHNRIAIVQLPTSHAGVLKGAHIEAVAKYLTQEPGRQVYHAEQQLADVS